MTGVIVTPLTARKIKILKNEKNAWRYHFTREPKTVIRRTDGRTDGKSDI